MMKFTGLVALEILATDIASDVTTAAELMCMVVGVTLEGDLALGADSWFFVTGLLTTRRRHDGSSCDVEGEETRVLAQEWMKSCDDERRALGLRWR